MFEVPESSSGKRKATTAAPGNRSATRRRILHDDDDQASEWSGGGFPPPTTIHIDDDDADVRAVQHQNRVFNDGLGPTPDSVADAILDSGDDARSRAANAFRPTALEQQIHTTIAHPVNKGKNAQCILECAQQARDNRFSTTLPVLRGAYDFGFHTRGLSVMHFERVTRAQTFQSPTTNMTDFSRENNIQPATTSPTYANLVDALHNRRRFGRSFYNNATVEVTDTATTFVETFGDATSPMEKLRAS
ncbi:hypothetical protein PR003_g9889 [Phytophthora rubi]|uniref:Uncharacterized protein n=1 Tax=Phytophthora rubi TaxID=129364 RepID=A0A6A4FSX8_9STRA|nr:hypothetical protein PR003_g9889 [Phytophthora rubi]